MDTHHVRSASVEARFLGDAHQRGISPIAGAIDAYPPGAGNALLNRPAGRVGDVILRLAAPLTSSGLPESPTVTAGSAIVDLQYGVSGLRQQLSFGVAVQACLWRSVIEEMIARPGSQVSNTDGRIARVSVNDLCRIVPLVAQHRLAGLAGHVERDDGVRTGGELGLEVGGRVIGREAENVFDRAIARLVADQLPFRTVSGPVIRFAQAVDIRAACKPHDALIIGDERCVANSGARNEYAAAAVDVHALGAAEAVRDEWMHGDDNGLVVCRQVVGYERRDLLDLLWLDARAQDSLYVLPTRSSGLDPLALTG